MSSATITGINYTRAVEAAYFKNKIEKISFTKIGYVNLLFI